MKFTAKQYAEALMDSITDTDPKHLDLVLDNFVQVLVDNSALRMFDEITEEFHKLELAKKGIKQVEITSVHPINQENEKEILHQLNKLVKGNLELKKKVDENIIGGVIVKIEDQMLDASVKNNLEQLRNELRM